MTRQQWALPQDRKPRVALLGPAESERVARHAAKMRSVIEDQVEIAHSDFEHDPAALDLDVVDFVITLGGDGTILRAATRVAPGELPVLGINLGRLGFLAGIRMADVSTALAEVLAGKASVLEHLMFACQIHKRGTPSDTVLGLNETAILGGPPFSILEVDLYVDSELVTTYSCDGLIISTPVGSTAHSLSAGGPILRKDLAAFLIQPISPHTLTMRPVVDTADRVFEVSVRNPSDSTSVVVDGSVIATLGVNDRVTVRRAEQNFRMIEVAGHGYYRTLRDKLGWDGRIQRRETE